MQILKISAAIAVAALPIGWAVGLVSSPVRFATEEEGRAAAAERRARSRMEILHNEHIVYGSGLKTMDDQLTIMRDRENGNLCYVFIKKAACIEQQQSAKQNP
jgi:hypothetical protein